MNKASENAYKTAINRLRAISAPMRHLVNSNLLKGSMLDYGCGKGQCADSLEMDKYDPHYFPDEALRDKYDTITCHYVLNVLTGSDIELVISKILDRLNDNGKAYLTVRRDIKQEGYTSKGTYQTNVTLDLPIIKEKKNAYCIYKLTH